EAGPKEAGAAWRYRGRPERYLGRAAESTAEDLHARPAGSRAMAGHHRVHQRHVGGGVGELVRNNGWAGHHTDGHCYVDRRAWRPGRAVGKHEVVAVDVEAGPKHRRRARRQGGTPKRQLGRPGETASETLAPGPPPRRPTAWAHPANDRWPGRVVGESVEGADQAGARADAHPDVECSHRAGRTDS